MQEFRKYGTDNKRTDCGMLAGSRGKCYINYTHIPDDSDIYIPMFDDDQETQTKNK